MINLKLTTIALSVFLSISFILCVLFGLATPQSVHMSQFLQNVLPGFKWLSIGSFILGLVESFLWGTYIGLVFTLVYNFLYRRWAQKVS